jgi:hypothetical protein
MAIRTTSGPTRGECSSGDCMVTDASVHDFQEPETLPDKAVAGRTLYADAAYLTGRKHRWLRHNEVHEKGSGARKLYETRNVPNPEKSRDHAGVEHISGMMNQHDEMQVHRNHRPCDGNSCNRVGQPDPEAGEVCTAQKKSMLFSLDNCALKNNVKGIIAQNLSENGDFPD